MNSPRVGVVGATGVLGGELVRLLAPHPGVELTAVCGSRSAGQLLHEVRPSLRGAGSLTVSEFDADRLAADCDVVFLALPHGTSAEPAAALLARGARVIDLGSDFRLRDADEVRHYYGSEAKHPELLAEAYYSLPELCGPIPPSVRLVANPGCFATALALALAPLARHLDDGAQVQVFGITGSSGSGLSPSPRVHHSLRRTSFTAYRSLRHQHLGEVRQLLASLGPVPEIAFIPHSSTLVRGIHLTVTCRRAALDGSALAHLQDAYAESTFVDAAAGEIPLGAVIGSNRALLGAVEDESTSVVFCAIDNLLKGGAGQAVQNMNLLLGLEESLGLPSLGSWP